MVKYALPTAPANESGKSVCEQLQVDAERGLASDEVAARLVHFGRNELPEVPPTAFWKLVLNQFEDMLVRILLAAAAVSFAMAMIEGNATDFVEPFIILLILTLNAVVGVWQENRAEGAIEALKEFVPSTAVVVRNGLVQTVHAEELVPGDIVEVRVGSRVPADIRLLKLTSTTLRVDQSILNGESEETMKITEALKRHDRFAENMIFSGTSVVYGKGAGVVVRTGGATEIGRVERDVREQEEVKTPLQVKLDEFGVLLSQVIGYICLAVFALNMLHHFRTHVPDPRELWYERFVQPVVYCLKVAVALAVAAIPEGLPAVVTTCLALGTRRMARHNALVRDLPSVETLGRCTVICSDKTGTLTTNRMSVVQVATVDASRNVGTYHIQDSQYNIAQNAVSHRGTVLTNAAEQDAALAMLTTVATMCNDAALQLNAGSGCVEKVGEATEAALLVMAEKLRGSSTVNAARLQMATLWEKVTTLEFTRSRKSMSVCCTSKTAKDVHCLLAKGAPENILSRCTRVMLSDSRVVALDRQTAAQILKYVDDAAKSEKALRCIGFAFKPIANPNTLSLLNPDSFESVENDLTFVGVSGMTDPPREEVRGAITDCQSAGIRVIVITGDKKETAEAVCRQIGLLVGDETEQYSYTGEEFDRMTRADKREAVMRAVVFSRTDPSHKMELVKLLQEQGMICAMTGDGVNDSPALKKADIGIAIGSGTEVAKAASKMVLADDNFATVVKAVREGRAIFNNTKQFIRYLISSNIGEVACVLVTGLFGLPEALSPIQLLWVNLVTDGLPATALGFNAPDPDIMEQPPRSVHEPIVNGWMFVRYLIVGIYVGLATVAGFLWWFLTNGFSWHDLTSYTTCTDLSNTKCATLANPETARAIALSILVVIEMLNALNALSENQSLVVVRPHTNVWLILAITSSLLLHLIIMYVPFFANMFSITPLGVPAGVVEAAAPWDVLVPTTFEEWKVIMVFSIPVIFIDELLKAVARWSHDQKKVKQA